MSIIRKRRAYSLLEVLFAVVIISIILIPSISAIQGSRVRMRSLSQHLVAENLAVSVMEMVKRAGFNDYAYGMFFDNVLDTSQVPTPLLDFPYADDEGNLILEEDEDDGEEKPFIPEGAPGGVSDEDFAAFLSAYRTGSETMDELAQNTAITSDTNYYFYSQDQIAAINGYSGWDAIPDEAMDTLLNPRYAWGFYSVLENGPDDTAGTSDDLRHVAVVVKWLDTRTGARRFTLLESWVVRQAHRLSLP